VQDEVGRNRAVTPEEEEKKAIQMNTTKFLGEGKPISDPKRVINIEKPRLRDKRGRAGVHWGRRNEKGRRRTAEVDGNHNWLVNLIESRGTVRILLLHDLPKKAAERGTRGHSTGRKKGNCEATS